MKPGLKYLFLLMLLFLFTSCSNSATLTEKEQTGSLEKQEDNTMQPSQTLRKIRLQTAKSEIIFELNNSTAATELYQQLPLTVELENFSNNEKIFYPPEKLSTANTPRAENKIGRLAYYEPWGDVVIFYGAFSPSGSLYDLGEVISGEDQLTNLSGTATIEAVI